MRRNLKWVALVMALLRAPSPSAQSATVMPVPQQVFIDPLTGNPCSGCKLYTYQAGTVNPLATYSDSILTPNTNPIVLDAGGSNPAGAIYLSSTSYKFKLDRSTGVNIWTRDNILAVPASTSNLDVTCQTGEAISAGQGVYISAGSGGKTAGRCYKADSANTYSSSSAAVIGVAPSAIANGDTGNVRIAGVVTGLSSLSVGSDYFAGAAGALTSTAPTNRRLMGSATSSTTLVLQQGPRSDEVAAMTVTGIDFVCGRLTLTSGTPETTIDVTAATTVYYALDGCDRISLYDGSATWNVRTFTELSIAVPATTATMYDVWIYDNSGTPALELLAWTNDTTRATALVRQNGRYVKTGATTRRYLGSFRTTTVSGQTEDSFAKRYVSNAYHRLPRLLRPTQEAGTWNYTLAAYRQMNANTANQLDIVIGIADVALEATVISQVFNGTGVTAQVSIGEDSTTTAMSNVLGGVVQTPTLTGAISATVRHYPAVGRHFYAALEKSGAAGTTSWGPTANGADVGGHAGIIGSIPG